MSIKRPNSGINTGVLQFPDIIRPRDWIAGNISGVDYEPRLAVPDWTSYLPSDEWQRNATLDTMACVSFSCNNCIETQLNWMLAEDLLSLETKNWLIEKGYLESNNKINFSDRWLAKVSNTTKDGNYLVVVGDAARKIGLVPEKLWPWDRSKEWSWEEYYKEPPAELYSLAEEFLEHFKINYEWIYTINPFGASDPYPVQEVIKQLHHAPLQIATPVCSPWNTIEVIERCGLSNASHATEKYGFMANVWNDYDSYDPFKKRLALNYQIPYALKIVININKIKPMSDEAKKFLQEHDKQLVLAIPSGRNAYIKGGVAREINTSDRGALAALAVLRENGHGTGIPDVLYDELPKQPF